MEVLNITSHLIVLLLVSYVLSSDPKCPAGSIVTAVGGGRTANCIWEYLALYFASKYLPNGQKPYSQRYINTHMSSIFENISLPVVEDIPKYCESCKNTNWLVHNTSISLFTPIKEAKRNTQNITGNVVLPKCVVFVEAVIESLQEVKQIIPYKNKLVVNAQKRLHEIKDNYYQKTNISNVTFVGVHIRRTDYIPLLKRYKRGIAGLSFYLKAIEYFRNRTDLGRPIFVIASDDIPWVRENLIDTDIYIASEGDIESPGIDMALLSYCNHSIVDYGTFGMWVALYTEGEVVTTLQSKNQFYLNLKLNPKWHFVNITQTEIVIT